MGAHLQFGEMLDRRPDVHRVAPQSIQLGHDQHIIPIKAVNETPETFTLHRWHRTGNGFRDDAPGIDIETCRFNLLKLIFNCLLCRAYTSVTKYSAHLDFPECIENVASNTLQLETYKGLYFDTATGRVLKTVDFVHQIYCCDSLHSFASIHSLFPNSRYQSFQPLRLVPVAATEAAENDVCLPSIPSTTSAPFSIVPTNSFPA